MKYVGVLFIVVVASACRIDFDIQAEPVDSGTGPSIDSSSGTPVDASPDSVPDASGATADADTSAPGLVVVTTGTDTIPTTATTAIVQLDPPVDPAHSVLFFNVTHNSERPDQGHVTGQLNDTGDMIIFERPLTGPVVAIEWSVIESPVLRVQRGTTLMSMALGNTRNIALDSPITDLNRAFAIATARLTGTNYGWNDWAMVRLVDVGSLRIDRTTGTCCDATVEWQVVEFAPDSGASVQSGVARMQAGQTFVPVLLGQPAPLGQSFMLFTQNTIDDNGGAAVRHFSIRGEMFSENEIAFTRPDSANAIDVGWFVVSWDRLRAQHGSTPFAGAQGQEIVTLGTPVDPANSISFLPGMMRQGSAPLSDDSVGQCWFTTRLINTGADLRIRRGDTGIIAEMTWTVVEFQ